MRQLALAFLLSGLSCGPRLTRNDDPNLSPHDMLRRSTLVFSGVIENHTLLPAVTLPSSYWRTLRRRVRVEQVFIGHESRPQIDVYEIFWTGGASGDWNSTQDGERALFLVSMENGHFRVVRDWYRSIFPIASGPHDRLPMDSHSSFWERYALMNYWYPSESRETYLQSTGRNDPAGALSTWRTVRLLRGLLRHPSPRLRIEACRQLLSHPGLDECYEELPQPLRSQLTQHGNLCCTPEHIAASRRRFAQQTPQYRWAIYNTREERRLLTTVRDRKLRLEFCRLWQSAYPNDEETGCTPSNPHPAAVVTEKGDVPIASS